MIGCKCAVCSSAAPKNRRLRPSGWVRIGGLSLLIDVGPDFRQQALKFGIDRIDALLLTHTHFDHIAGVDELRVFNFRQREALPCFLSKESGEDLKKRYDYLFRPIGTGPTHCELDLRILKHEAGSAEFKEIPIGYCSFSQGGMKVTGFRIGDFAYVSDIRKYDETVFEMLQGIRQLVLGALKPEANPFHFSFDEAVAFARRAGVEKTWLTHLGHFIDHEEGNERLPPEVRLGYDGLELEIEIR